MQPEISRMDPRTSVVDIPRKPRNRRKRNLILTASAAAVLATITFGFSRLRAAAPVVDRGGLWTDTVKRGPMLREVKGPGTLVPERVRLITADTAGRVERIPLGPGAQVERAEELRSRLDLERKRRGGVAASGKEQVAAQEAEIERLRAVVAFRRNQVDSMKVRSVDRGVLSELPLELGQWVTPGALLAKVVQPERLKAVLRIPETQARDLALHLAAAIDTRNGLVQGQVSLISPAANQGSVEVDVSLPAELPGGARPDLTAEGTIATEK